MTAFPAALDAFAPPGDTLADPPHHLMHAALNTAVAAVQAKLGTDNSADPQSVDYKLTKAARPGHTHAPADIAGLAAVATSGRYADLTDKPLPALGGAYQVLRVNVTGTALEYAAVPAAVPGGSSGQVQVNNGGVFGANANFTTYSTPAPAVVRIGTNALPAGSGCLDLFRGNNSTGSQVFRVVAGDGNTVRFSIDGEGNVFSNSNIQANSFAAPGGLPVGGNPRNVYAVNGDYPLGILANFRSVEYSASAGDVVFAKYKGFAGQTADFMQFQASSGTVQSLINAGGEYEVTDSAKGVILRSPNGTRWRVQVNNLGVLTTTSI